jgi:flagellar basal body P-ring formation protein FlgA
MFPFLFLFAVAPQAFENLEAVDQRVLAVTANAQPIDKRLKLAQCPEQPIIAPPVGGSVIVRCPSKGWRLRVPVRASTTESHRAQTLVHKGQMVEAISEGPGFSVSTNMIALEDGGAGAAIRVKSPSSPAQTTATVKARGVVSF